MEKIKSKKEQIKEFVENNKVLVGISTLAGAATLIGITVFLGKKIKPKSKAKLKSFDKVIPIIEKTDVMQVVEEQCEEVPERLYKFNVNRHIRNLHEGFKASETKIQSALENNIELQPGQTWVDDYIKTNKKEEMICQSL